MYVLVSLQIFMVRVPNGNIERLLRESWKGRPQDSANSAQNIGRSVRTVYVNHLHRGGMKKEDTLNPDLPCLACGA